MSNQGNYKRTVAGSVGAGVGAIFNGSGRTYYILEHKTQSQFHNIGESQKIIIDQIEMGRASSCQVRWEDTQQFEMVSRRHAAIIRDGNNWELIHLSTSNPTLVNGQPIHGHYYLQSGDEIQLAAGGPRMGFIVPQGKQAMTSSIRLTERMNLFRQQALAPYKKALWAMGILLTLVILGFGTWNYKLSQDNKELISQAEQLVHQSEELDNQIHVLEEKIKNNPENAQLKQQIDELKQRRQSYGSRITTIVKENPALAEEIKRLKEQLDESKATSDNDEDDDEDEAGKSTMAMKEEGKAKADDVITINDGSSDDIANYADDVYIIKIDRIQVEYGGLAKDPGIATAYVNVGTGFRANGSFITARSNIQPWIYRKGLNEPWRDELAKYKALGFNIRIWFSAYSSKGTTNRIQFDTDQINTVALEANDIQETITITKEFLKGVNILGYNFVWKEYKSRTFTVPVYTAASHSAVKIGVGSGNIPSDNAKAANLKGGEEIQIAGYHGVSQHSVSGDFDFATSNTRRAAGYFITLQNAPGNDRGYLGSPGFCKDENGRYKVVGVYVGSFGGEARLVPLTRVH